MMVVPTIRLRMDFRIWDGTNLTPNLSSRADSCGIALRWELAATGLAPAARGAAWTPTRAARARVKGRRRRSRRDAKRHGMS
jgi:hypothetical protein